MEAAVQKRIQSVHIRWMIARDMPSVLAIEEAGYACPWTEEDFCRCLRQRNCIGMVAEAKMREGEYKIVGFMIYELEDSHLQILRMAVAAAHRRTGIAAQLVDKLKSKLCSHRRTSLCTDIAESNLPAQLFLRSQGFLATRILRSECEDNGEDAYRMEYCIG